MEDKERLARIEENLKNLSACTNELKKDMENINRKLDETLPEFLNELKGFLNNTVGKYAQREWVESLDRRMKEVEFWKERTDPQNNLGERFDQLNTKVSVGIGIITVIAPLVYYIIQRLVDNLF